MEGREPLLAPLQQTDSRTAMGRGLPPRRRAIMLEKDQGSANSRRSSPGSGASTPLRDAFEPLPPVDRPSLQLNQPAGTLPTAFTWPSSAATLPRAAWLPGSAKLAPSFAAANKWAGDSTGISRESPLAALWNTLHSNLKHIAQSIPPTRRRLGSDGLLPQSRANQREAQRPPLARRSPRLSQPPAKGEGQSSRSGSGIGPH